MSTTRSPAPRAPATDAAAASSPPGSGPAPRWDEAALVLLAHGSRRSDGAARATLRHAERLRRRGLFAEVRAGFLREDPSAEAVLAQVAAPQVYLVPLLMSEGYIVRSQIVERLGLTGPVTLRPGASGRAQRLLLCRPVGTHPRLPAVIDDRIRALCGRFGLPPAEVSVILVGHGTPRHPGSRLAAERCRDALAAGGRYAAVGTAFLDEAPRPDEALRRCATRHVIAAGLFAADGPHGGEDVPDLLGVAPVQDADGRAVGANPGGTVFYTGAIGADDGIADLVLDCVREADDRARPAGQPAAGA